MKAVLDVGQYVSATIQGRGHPAQILAAWRAGQFELVTSMAILHDLRRVLRYPHVRKRHRWSDDEIDLFVDSIALAASLTSGALEVHAVAEDPTDDKVLACALEGQADYVVASDEHLLRLEGHSQIAILPPRRFLEVLAQSQEGATRAAFPDKGPGDPASRAG